jgi:hypothetical protein
LPLLAATAWIGLGFSVYARDFGYGETVFITPTSTTYSLAPSYLVSTSYVRPTAYVVPSSYSTAYVVPSAYVATDYVVPTTYVAEPLSIWPTSYYVATAYRRGLFGRRWLVERPVIASYGTSYYPSVYTTSYVPTSYVYPSYYTTSYRVRTYAPTVYEYPTVWETASVVRRGDCDEIVPAAPASPPAPSRAIQSRPSPRTGPAEAGSYEDPTIPSNVDPLRQDERSTGRASGSDAATKAQAPAARRADSPPEAPAAPAGEKAQAPKSQTNQAAPKANAGAREGAAGASKQDTDAATKAKAAAPTAPAGESNEIDLRPAPGVDGSGTIRREAGKPIYSTRALRPERQNILIGRVESAAGEPVSEVPVTVTNRSNSLIHHDGLSNAFGGFAIRLTDGEWTVNVTMPSGRVYPVRSVTVSNGRVVDNQEGREVHSLIITY